MEQDVLLLNGSRVVAMDENKVLLTEMCPLIAGSGISVQNVLRTGKSVGHSVRHSVRHRHSVSDTDTACQTQTQRVRHGHTGKHNCDCTCLLHHHLSFVLHSWQSFLPH